MAITEEDMPGYQLSGMACRDNPRSGYHAVCIYALILFLALKTKPEAKIFRSSLRHIFSKNVTSMNSGVKNAK